MKKTTKRKIIVALAAISIFMLYEFATLIYTWIDDQETSSKHSLSEYDDLFNKKELGKLQILATVTSRNRLPVSTYVYDEKYNVCVFKVILSKNVNLKTLIHYQNESSSKSLNATYADLPSYNFDMSIKAGKLGDVSSLYFKSSGDSIKPIINNDTLYCYYCKFKTFSINYNDEAYDIIANADVANIPASVVFRKRNKVLYIILMTVAKGKEEMQPGLLYDIINK